jgi:hypothetical protein
MRALLVVPFVVFLIFVLKNKENYYGQIITGSNQKASILNIGLDININNWTSSSAALGSVTGLGGTTTDAQQGPAPHQRLQIADLNRICWSDTTGKCAGFRKKLQPGGGGPLWYLYTATGNLPSAISGQSQEYSVSTLAIVNNLNIPQYVVCSKSIDSPMNSQCSWIKTARTCSVTTPGQCNTPGVWLDTYNVTNYVAGQCFGSEGQGLNAGVQTVTGAPCTTPLCPSGYSDGIPGTVNTPTTPSPGWSLTATSIIDCQNACTAKSGCKIIQYTPGPPASCIGYASITSIKPDINSFIYTHP